jgi:hypothetical protein
MIMGFDEYILINHLNNGTKPEDKETLGYLSYIPKIGKPLNLFTIELPWKNNEPFISRIPAEIYPYTKYKSPSNKTTVFLLHNVPGRSEIEIHIANYVRELKGCIAVGLGRGDIDGDGLIDVKHSKAALDALLAATPERGFVKIVDL